jgi:hypothetical protein
MTENIPEQEVGSLEKLYSLYTPQRGYFGFTYGSKRRTKIIDFCRMTKVTNPIIDGYMKIPPKRLEHETREDYKNRLTFQKDLLRFRSAIYDYSVYNQK